MGLLGPEEIDPAGKSVAEIGLAGAKRNIGCLGPWKIGGEDWPGLRIQWVVLKTAVFRQR